MARAVSHRPWGRVSGVVAVLRPGELHSLFVQSDTASQYLAEAGFPNGKGLPTLNWTIASNCDLCQTRAEVVQADVAQIGINIAIQVVTSDQWCQIICEPYSYLINNTQTVSNIIDTGGSGRPTRILISSRILDRFCDRILPVFKYSYLQHADYGCLPGVVLQRL